MTLKNRCNRHSTWGQSLITQPEQHILRKSFMYLVGSEWNFLLKILESFYLLITRIVKGTAKMFEQFCNSRKYLTTDIFLLYKSQIHSLREKLFSYLRRFLSVYFLYFWLGANPALQERITSRYFINFPIVRMLPVCSSNSASMENVWLRNMGNPVNIELPNNGMVSVSY